MWWYLEENDISKTKAAAFIELPSLRTAVTNYTNGINF